jgi:DNA end-binding protein Ku
MQELELLVHGQVTSLSSILSLVMAPRSFWKGYLKLSLVNCPVAMIPATTESEKIRFHTLNRETGNRVVSQYVDAESGKPVDEDDEVTGYPRGEDEFVLLEDEELDAVALESTRTIDIETFAPADSIEWIWYDKPHYLMPDDPVGEEAFSVIRDAMESTGTVGISRLVMYRRERAVMLEPRDKGIVLWTLRYGDEVRDPGEYFNKIGDGKLDPKLMNLVTTLIEEKSKPWDPDMARDPVQAHLREIISAKKRKNTKRAAKKRAEPEATPSNVVSIMDALRKSISSDAKASKRG